MKRSESNIDELFRDQLLEYEASPDVEVWDNISNQMDLKAGAKSSFLVELRRLLSALGISSSLILAPVLLTLFAAGDSSGHDNFSVASADVRAEEASIKKVEEKTITKASFGKSNDVQRSNNTESSAPVNSAESGRAEVPSLATTPSGEYESQGVTTESEKEQVIPQVAERREADSEIVESSTHPSSGVVSSEVKSYSGSSGIDTNDDRQAKSVRLKQIESSKKQMLEEYSSIRKNTLSRQFGVEGDVSTYLGSYLEFPVYDTRYYNHPGLLFIDSLDYVVMGGNKWALHAVATDDVFFGASLERMINYRVSLQTTWIFYSRFGQVRNEYATLNLNYYFRPDGKNTFKALAGVGYSGRLIAEFGGAMFYELSSRFNAFLEPRLTYGLESQNDTGLRVHFGVRLGL